MVGLAASTAVAIAFCALEPSAGVKRFAVLADRPRLCWLTELADTTTAGRVGVTRGCMEVRRNNAR